MLNNAMNVVIFSKDRPMQLDACLYSLRRHLLSLHPEGTFHTTVVYKASENEYSECYESLSADYSEITFKKQGTFRVDTLGAIDPEAQFTMFLVDDIIFKSDVRLSDGAFGLLRNNDQMIGLSLRLHKGAKYCYATDSNMTVPKFVRDVPGQAAVWRWPGCEGDWGYAMSLDGNVFNTKFILRALDMIDFANPNSLEAALNSPQILSGIIPLYSCCYDGVSKLFNSPVNRVQNVFKNRHEDSYSEKELNEKFKEGYRISIDEYTGMDNISVHYPVDYKFIKRG